MLTAIQLLEKVNVYLSEFPFSRDPRGLYDPVKYVLSMGGKRIRPVLMLMAYNMYKEDVEKIFPQATGIETYHNYTLLHDDLMDRADMRRNCVTVHKKWDDNTAILSGDAMLVLAYQFMIDSDSECLKDILSLFSRTALEICEGQQFDMEFESRMDVTEAEYIEMIRLKTAVLLAASLKIGAQLGGATQKDAQLLYDFGIQMGLAFQLKDDLLDVYGDPAIFGKNIGGDILCNKKTYLLIKSLQNSNKVQKAELEKWLSCKEPDPELKISGVRKVYDEIGVRQICETKMNEYYNKGNQFLSEVGLPDNKKLLIREFAEELMYRNL